MRPSHNEAIERITFDGQQISNQSMNFGVEDRPDNPTIVRGPAPAEPHYGKPYCLPGGVPLHPCPATKKRNSQGGNNNAYLPWTTKSTGSIGPRVLGQMAATCPPHSLRGLPSFRNSFPQLYAGSDGSRVRTPMVHTTCFGLTLMGTRCANRTGSFPTEHFPCSYGSWAAAEDGQPPL